MTAFEAENVPVYALSYDEADALRDFRDAHGITYTLLSDPDSTVIRAFGILNELIDPDDHPWFGIPYPGTYVVDADGVITHKFFDANLAVRAGPEQLLRAARGEASDEVPGADPGAEHVSPQEVEVDVHVDAPALSSTVQRDLVVRFDVPDGRHVYAAPAPKGSVAVDVRLDAHDRLVVRELQRPPSEPHRLGGSGEQFEVHHGRFELRVPLALTRGASETFPEVRIAGELAWQVCDDEVCDLPVRRRFELVVPVSETVALALGDPRGATREPNAAAHFQRMSERRR